MIFLKQLNNEQTLKLLGTDNGIGFFESIKNHIFEHFTKTTYIPKPKDEIMSDSKILSLLTRSFSIDKTNIEQWTSNGLEDSVCVAGGSCPVDVIQDNAFDTKLISWDGKGKTNETSLAQKFKGDDLDSGFVFENEDLLEIINSQNPIDHPRIVKVNNLLKDKWKDIYNKFSYVKNKYPKIDKVIYLVFVKNGLNFTLLAFELFPELSHLKYNELPEYNDLSKDIVFLDLDVLLKMITKYNKKEKFKEIRQTIKKSGVKNLYFNKNLFISHNCDIHINLYKSKKRIELRLSKIYGNISINFNESEDIRKLLRDIFLISAEEYRTKEYHKNKFTKLLNLLNCEPYKIEWKWGDYLLFDYILNSDGTLKSASLYNEFFENEKTYNKNELIEILLDNKTISIIKGNKNNGYVKNGCLFVKEINDKCYLKQINNDIEKDMN
jgi:hypothetical protein